MYGVFAILLASVFWGTTGTMAAQVPDVTSYALGALSTGLGGTLLSLTAYKSIRQDWKTLCVNYRLCLLGGLCVAFYPMAFYTSMRFSGVAIGTVICIATSPFAAAILERVLSKQGHFGRRWIGSLCCGVIGVILMSWQDTPKAMVDDANGLFALGIFIAALSGFAYAGYTWVAKQLIERGVKSASAMGCQFGVSALLLVPSLWWTGHAWLSDSHHLWVASYMIVIPICTGYLLFGYGLKTVAASQATLLSLLEPLIATLLAVTIVGEKLNLFGWIGMVAIMICLLIQSWPTRNVKVEYNPV